MIIQEAIKVALEEGKFITRDTDGFEAFRIQPTQTNDCFVVHISKEYINQVGEEYTPGKRWNPMVEDILAIDWIVKPL
ncbi:MAG: MW1434 family type I TA system toxin [Solibacillus sp.]